MIFSKSRIPPRITSGRALSGSSSASGRGSRIRRLEHAAANLIFFDRDKQRPEIAFAKTFIALALDELEKDWADQIGREDLQQNLGHAPLLFADRDCAFAIDQDAVAHKPRQIFAMAGHTLVHALVIGGRRCRHKAEPVGTQSLDDGVDVAAAASDVLDAFA